MRIERGLLPLKRYTHVGADAQAGSDSLLTSSTFLKLTRTCFDGVAGMEKHMGVLYGLGSGAAGSTLLSICVRPQDPAALDLHPLSTPLLVLLTSAPCRCRRA